MNKTKKALKAIADALSRIYWLKFFIFLFSITIVAGIIPILWVWFFGELTLAQQGSILSLAFAVTVGIKYVMRFSIKPKKDEPFDLVDVSMSRDGKRIQYKVRSSNVIKRKVPKE